MYPERLQYLAWFQAVGNRPHRYWPRKCESGLSQFFDKWGLEGSFLLIPKNHTKIISQNLILENFTPVHQRYSGIIEMVCYMWGVRPIWRYHMVTSLDVTQIVELMGYAEPVKCVYRILRWLINGFENYNSFWVKHIPKVNKKELKLYGRKQTYPGSILNESRKKLTTALIRIINFLIEKLDKLQYKPNLREIDEFIIYSRNLAYKAVYGTKTKRVTQALAPKNKFKQGGIVNGGFKRYSGKYRNPSKSFRAIGGRVSG